jgi:acyl-CoA synthetase (AMP-forming)/AMP-acid ligase II
VDSSRHRPAEPTHLADLVAAAAGRQPDHPALVDAAGSDPGSATTLTWAELDATVSAEAGRLRAHGVVPGDRVAVRTASAPVLAVAVLGAPTAPRACSSTPGRGRGPGRAPGGAAPRCSGRPT